MPTKNETNMNNLVIATASGTSPLDVNFTFDVDTVGTLSYIPYNRFFGIKEWKRWLRKIDRVIFNDPATIILWKSGEKTVVKCGPNETFDKEKGLAMALCKYILGNKGNFNQFFKALMKEDK